MLTYNPEPNATEPRLFAYFVGDNELDEQETFSEGWHLLHNPWAENPLDLCVLRDVTEHQMLEDGRVLTTCSRMDTYASVTCQSLQWRSDPRRSDVLGGRS
jgi:hypothetical protein